MRAMYIHEVARQAGVPVKTIRYYESIGLIPRPQRAENNYRQYAPADVDRLRFVASARSLGFSINDVAEFLAARDDGLLPCQRVLNSVEDRLAEIDRRIADLLALRETLDGIRRDSLALPRNEESAGQCVCYLLTADRASGQVTIQREERTNGDKTNAD